MAYIHYMTNSRFVSVLVSVWLSRSGIVSSTYPEGDYMTAEASGCIVWRARHGCCSEAERNSAEDSS